MNDEMLALLKENNELLHRIADYIDKADSPKYTYNRQMQSSRLISRPTLQPR